MHKGEHLCGRLARLVLLLLGRRHANEEPAFLATGVKASVTQSNKLDILSRYWGLL